jgi:hypothetical protein
MDFEKLKKDLEEKGVEKGQEELEKLKARLGGFNSGELSTTGDHQEHKEAQANPPGHGAEAVESGRTGATPVMDSGKADIGEPDSPGDEEEIREPRPEEEQVQTANDQGAESRREAAMEQNPANDEENQAEDAA